MNGTFRKLLFVLVALTVAPAIAGAAERRGMAPMTPASPPTISGFIQTLYYDSQSAGESGGFDIYRAHLAASGRLSRDLAYELRTDLGGGTAVLLDAYVDLALDPVTLRIGQFKYPFSLEGLEGDTDTPLILRSETVKTIAGSLGTVGGFFRDRGVQVSGDVPGGLKGLSYAVAVVNGNGVAAGTVPPDTNPSKDIVGRVDLEVSRDLHVGASIFRGKRFPSVDESAIGVHGEWKSGQIRIRGELINADFTTTEPKGLYIVGGFKVNGPLELVAGIETMEQNSAVASTGLDTITLGATYTFNGMNNLKVNYLIRDAETGVGAGFPEFTNAAGTAIDNLLIAQLQVVF